MGKAASKEPSPLLPTDSQLAPITLATLPPDVIRIIVNMDNGETLRTMRLISHTWRSLVAEYVARLPSIDDVRLEGPTSLSASTTVSLTLQRHYLGHFAPDLLAGNANPPPNRPMSIAIGRRRRVNARPTSRPTLPDSGPVHLDCRTGFGSGTPEKDTRASLVRLNEFIGHASRIETLSITFLGAQNLLDFRFMADQFVDMARQHSIDVVECDAGVEFGKDLSNFLLEISAVTHVRMIGGRCQYEESYHNLYSLFCLSEPAKDNIRSAMRITEGSITFKCCCGAFNDVLLSPYLEFLKMFADWNDLCEL